jgi:dTMP kinase
VKRGTFVVFEGLDGSGKTTQLERLARALEAAGHDVVRTREPHDGPAGRRIRAMARSGRRPAPEEELAWFREQRRDHVREVVGPALAAGRVVLCDRYTLSTAAYQGARGLDAEAILRDGEAAFPQPDLVVLLEIPPEEALARIASRGEPHEPAFEELDTQRQVAAVFARLERPYVVRIDGRGPAREVAQRVADVVRCRLHLL